MRAKFGSIIVSGAGSLGGHTVQNSLGGAQMRTKPINKKAPTAAQSRIRALNPQLQQGWQALTEIQRTEWNVYPINNGVFNKNGEKHPLSGHSLWMKWNFLFVQHNLPVVQSVFTAAQVHNGSSVIKNGSFDTFDNWVVTGGAFLVPGGVRLPAIINDSLNQDLALELGAKFFLSFDVFDSLGTTRLFFRNQSFFDIFCPPYAGAFLLGAGKWGFFVETCVTATILRVVNSAAGDGFSFTNLSLIPLNQ